jgi:uncharacterized protein
MHDILIGLLLLAVGFWAGVQNALAGGGSFLTFPVLLLVGMGVRAANITSTVALFPGQVTTGIAGRSLVSGVGKLPFWLLAAISIVGGGLGALLLLGTPESVFSALVPWLVLFATVVLAWGSFRKSPDMAVDLPPWGSAFAQFVISIYGGYFGGGIGILMIAALTLAGLDVRHAAGTKNVLAAAINLAAVAIFAVSPEVHWVAAVVVGVGAIGGGQVGAWALKRVNDRYLRIAVILLGVALTVGLFLKHPG